MSTKHFNIFNTGESSFLSPGVQLANIARVKPNAPAIVYINPENKESVMTWHSLEVLSNRIAWYLLEQGIKPGQERHWSLCPIFPPTLLLLLESGKQVDVMYLFLREYPAKI